MGYGTFATIEGNHERERLVVNLCHDEHGSAVELCRESWSDSVGWFVQSRVRLQPSELPALRAALGAGCCMTYRSSADRCGADSGPTMLKFPRTASA
jgi:hypothetical protein